MSEDYVKGFKDGFAAGLEEGKKMNNKTYTDGFIEGMKTTMPPPYVPQPTLPGFTFEVKDTCPKCGIKINGVMGYVCSSINCPTFYKATSDVGSEVGYTTGTVNINGPSISQINPMGEVKGKTTNEQGYNNNWEIGSYKWHQDNPIMHHPV